MIEQKLYQCNTCNMVKDNYYNQYNYNTIPGICEPCIINCHKDHDVFQTDAYDEGFGLGCCDCGEEGSRGIRSCKMLKGM